MSVGPFSDFENLDSAVVHASCVAVDGRGLLIAGASGSGKSALTLQMMALGAGLVADDRVALQMDNNTLIAGAAPNISGVIEARGIGLLRASPVGPVPIDWVADLSHGAQERLPHPVTTCVLRQTVPLLLVSAVPNLPAALMQLMKMGRVNPEWPNL